MKKNKNVILLITTVLFSAHSMATEKTERIRSNPCKNPVKFSAGIHTGTDVGGAMPWPVSNIIGGDNKINATPHLKPAWGLSATTVYNRRLSLTCEPTYKTVALSAKAWVEGQTFFDRRDDPWLWVNYRGATSMEMSFPMVEIPLYIRYTMGRGYNRLLLGGYYARVFNPKFVITPYQGMLFKMTDDGPDYDNQPGAITSPYTQDFSDAMTNWDAGVMMGYERRIFTARFLLSGRFMMGLSDIFQSNKKYLSYSMLHMRGTLMLSYLFLKK